MDTTEPRLLPPYPEAEPEIPDVLSEEEEERDRLEAERRKKENEKDLAKAKTFLSRVFFAWAVTVVLLTGVFTSFWLAVFLMVALLIAVTTLVFIGKGMEPLNKVLSVFLLTNNRWFVWMITFCLATAFLLWWGGKGENRLHQVTKSHSESVLAHALNIAKQRDDNNIKYREWKTNAELAGKPLQDVVTKPTVADVIPPDPVREAWYIRLWCLGILALLTIVYSVFTLSDELYDLWQVFRIWFGEKAEGVDVRKIAGSVGPVAAAALGGAVGTQGATIIGSVGREVGSQAVWDGIKKVWDKFKRNLVGGRRY